MATNEGEKCPVFHTQLFDRYEYVIMGTGNALHVAILINVNVCIQKNKCKCDSTQNEAQVQYLCHSVSVTAVTSHAYPKILH